MTEAKAASEEGYHLTHALAFSDKASYRASVLALVALAPRVEWESWPQAVRVLTTGRARGIFPGAKPSEPQVEA